MTNRTKWPRRGLAAVPPLKIAKELAELVYQSCDLTDFEIEDALDRIYIFGRFDVNYNEFGEGVQAEALIFPLAEEDNRFGILVDTLNKNEEESHYNILHEVGHSFFYHRMNGDMPRRRLGGSDKEEIFCDEFASQLLRLICKK